ncbi:unnamed protein product [Cuscuta campestris]|uniref:Uncharacterized protein n=1 Tax=Cuscuta campestris TaxID=132261 RepID=A0A484KIY4_9ASTE|nr:unnamed protein product [Cuscuta campestris]
MAGGGSSSGYGRCDLRVAATGEMDGVRRWPAVAVAPGRGKTMVPSQLLFFIFILFSNWFEDSLQILGGMVEDSREIFVCDALTEFKRPSLKDSEIFEEDPRGIGAETF